MRLMHLGRLHVYWDGLEFWKDFSIWRTGMVRCLNLGPLSIAWYIPMKVNVHHSRKGE